MHQRLKDILLIAASAAAAAALTGCGGAGSGEGPPAEAEATVATTAQVATSTVAVTDSPFGPILVNGDGLTLYVYTEDKDGKIACLDEPAAYSPGDPTVFPCTEPWPALLTESEPTAGEGVDASLLGTVERPEGGTQVTYNGHPLYRSSFDFAPGSTFGKGAWGQWFLVTVEGEPQTVTTEG